MLPEETPRVPFSVLSPKLKEAAKQRVADVVSVAQEKLGIRMPMPTISFDLRGTTAGKAMLSKNHVQLNSVLLRENETEFLRQTVGHEVAHLITYFRFGPKAAAHGAEWKSVMQAIGLEPIRCHSYNTDNARVGGVFVFKCKCTEFRVGLRRAKTLRQGALCRKCAGRVFEVGAVPGRTSTPATSSLVSNTPSKPAPKGPSTSVEARRLEPPTLAMVDYAKRLATLKGLVLIPLVLQDKAACSQFISQALQLPDKDAPTPRQLELAAKVAARHKTSVPTWALASKASMSRWLSEKMTKSTPSPVLKDGNK